MVRETMTSEERILAAINLKPYDRVPAAPHINAEYPFRHKGRITADAYDPALIEEGFQATLELFEEVGGWDGATLAGHAIPVAPDSLSFFRGRGGLSGYRYPGRSSMISNDSSPQYEETPLLSVKDYDDIIILGWRGFLQKAAEEASVVTPPDSMPPLAKALTDRYNRFVEEWRRRGVPVISGDLLIDPQMALSLLRTLPQFTLDLYRRPDKVQAALDAMVRFVWPYIKKMVLAWAAEGYVTTLHFDTDWTLNLPYLLELPPKTCICELDSTTDIFKAKEILKDHMCIMGDVPPALSSHGTPEEMQAYCQKLIDIVGKDTGFILSTGCAVPPDTKDENFKMMIDTARNYYPYS